MTGVTAALNRLATALAIRLAVAAVAGAAACGAVRAADGFGRGSRGADVFDGATAAAVRRLTADPPFYGFGGSETEGSDAPVRAEPELWKLANGERQAAGLPPLVWDERLAAAALAKTGDMVRRGYFSLDSPGVGSADDWLRRFGVRFRAAAMDVACNRSAEEAFRMLVVSPVYRRHMLDPAFTRTGAGAAVGGPCGGMFAQLFAD